MVKSYYTILIILSGLLFLAASSEDINSVSEQERFEQYLIGINYLEAANDLSIEEKVSYYKKLVELTDFSANKARNYLNQYIDNPERWEKTINAVVSLLETNTQLNKE